MITTVVDPLDDAANKINVRDNQGRVKRSYQLRCSSKNLRGIVGVDAHDGINQPSSIRESGAEGGNNGGIHLTRR